MGIQEAVAESHRRFVAERAERIEAEQVARAVQVAEAAEKERNADRDRRRAEARRDASLNYVQKRQASGAFGESALKANLSSTVFNTAVGDPTTTIERLFGAWAEMQATGAAHRIVLDRYIQFCARTANPGQENPVGPYVDHTVVPPFGEVLERVLATRTALAVRAVPNEGEFYAAADAAGDQAAKAVQA